MSCHELTNDSAPSFCSWRRARRVDAGGVERLQRLGRRRRRRRESVPPHSPCSANASSVFSGTAAGRTAIEESIFAGVPINVTLLFSTRAVPGRRRRLHARDRAPDRGRPRPGRRLGGLAVHQPLGRRRRRQAPDELRNRLGIAVGKRTYARLPRAARLRPLAAPGERGRAAAAAAVGEHRDEGPRRLRHALHRGASRRRSRSTRCPRRRCWRSPTTARSASRCPPTAATPSEVLAAFDDAGIDIDALAARLQEEGAEAFVKSWKEHAGLDRSRSSAQAAAYGSSRRLRRCRR